ncbi:MAG: hypothetical protein V5A52_07795 [Halovenus sp.]
MKRHRTPPTRSTDTQTDPALVLTFAGQSDGQDRRVRYLACPEDETIWRIEERRRDAAWQIHNVEPIEELHLTRPQSAPQPQRQTDLAI